MIARFIAWLKELWNRLLGKSSPLATESDDCLVRVVVEDTAWLVKSPATGWLRVPMDGRWTFNGSLSRPTFSPSVVEQWPTHDGSEYINHVFIRDGRMQYLSDCTHDMAGQTIDIPPLTSAEIVFYACQTDEKASGR